MKVACIIATYGSEEWRWLAEERAYPSTRGQGFSEVRVAHEPDGTLAEVRNEAAASVDADALCFLDADDRLAPGYLRAMEPWLTPRAVIQTGGDPPPGGETPPHLLAPSVEYVYPNGLRTGPGIPNEGRWPEVNVAVIGTVVSKQLFTDVGGFRELPSIEDYDLWLRCWDAGATMTFVRDAVYIAHVRADSRNADQACYEKVWGDHLERLGQ